VSHTGLIENLVRGTYTLNVKCRDAGNLEESKSVNFVIQKAQMPAIIRMFSEGTDLRLETDIKAKCVYSIDDKQQCGFDANKAENMTTMNNYMHIATLVREWTYYVKCRDFWGDNSWPATSCSAIVKPFELPSI